MQDLNTPQPQAAPHLPLWRSMVSLLRPKQWLKNGFVFGPPFFAGILSCPHSFVEALIAAAAFSLAASSIYCFNDIHDVADDRRHPVKRHRPVASGAVSVGAAYTLMAVMFVLALATCWLIAPVWDSDSRRGGEVAGHTLSAYAMAVIIAYWLLNIAYTARLKQYAIIDVCIVAFGFVLRLLAGGFATNTWCSHWIVLMTFLVTLFMSFAKRRDDVVRMEATGQAPRANTVRYNTSFMNLALAITASITTVCYIMYTVSPEVVNRFHSHGLYLTTIFVLIGLLRYLQITVVDKKSDDPTRVMWRDRPMQLVVLCWALSFLLIIYM